MAAGVSACGGGGHGYGAPANPIVITSNALPSTLSGQEVAYCLPFTGGAGGPYILEVIDGALPKGVTPDSQTVCLVGRALEDGVFNFTLKLTDTGSQPFSTTTETYQWAIGIGSLVFATDASLAPFVYNRFDSIPLVVAGGVPPYSCDVVDDPNNPSDELLPTGLSIPPDSCTIVGAPTGVKQGQAPFVYKVSVRARDHADDPYYPNPSTVVKEFTITVLIPEVVISTASLPDGKCGKAYAEKIEILDGIPPFLHRIVDAVGSSTVLSGDLQSVAKPASGLPGPVAKGGATSAYALDTTAGPYTARFPEGIYIREATGDIVGLPRRTGVFNQWTYWVQSTVLPAIPSQNKWKAYSFQMADSVPPNVAMDPAFLLPNQTFTAPNNLLGSWEIGQTKFVQFLATGGVAADGYCDAPHEGQRTVVASEQSGRYNWANTTLVGTPDLSQLGLSLTPYGYFGGSPTARGGYRTLNLSVTDFQLPTPASAAHTATGTCRFDIGPDSVIVTESTVAMTNQAVAMGSWTLPAGSVNHPTYEYNDVKVEVWEPYSSGSTIRPLDDAKDLSFTHTLPAGPNLSTLLTGIDIMSLTVNPTWWAYDGYNINAQGARAMQHGDPQRLGNGYTLGGDTMYASSYYYYNLGQSSSAPDTYERAADTCIELPKVPGVAHSPGTGVYNDGGQMYAFENGTYFGVFIVRRDSRIYIPFAMSKSSAGIEGFGDAVLTSDRTKSGVFRKPQISVSPDGRFAAAKLKVDVDNFVETCLNEKIVFFSLTGEKSFSGATYRVTTNTGGSGNTNDGQYMYGSSFALTNKYLYFLKGNNAGSTSSATVMYRDHWVYRCDILTGNPALLSGPGGSWTNTSGSALAVPFQRWAPPSAPSLTTQYSNTWGPSTGNGSENAGPSSSSKSPPDFFAFHWANFAENSSAPMPFRVSKDGKACAILAAPVASAGTTFSSTFMSYYLFLDYDGAGTLRQVGTQRRYMAPTRLAGLRGGEQLTKLHGWFTGPATQLEVSDDGKGVAAVYNAGTGSWYDNGIANYGQSGTREDLVVYVSGTSTTDPWASVTTHEVTPSRFVGGVIWRFGALTWTRDNAGVVFWGGCSLYQPTSTYVNSPPAYPNAMYSGHMCGTLYSYVPSSSTCQSILQNTDGGSTDNVKTVSSSSTALSGGVPADWSGNQGALQPIGCFHSNDGNFYYMENMGALASSGTPTNLRLVGVNVKHSDPASTTNTINGRAPLRAFAPTWPAGRGWGPGGAWSSSPYPHMSFSHVVARASSRIGSHVSVADTNGLVFYVSYWQEVNTFAGSENNFATMFTGGGPAHPTAWDDGARQSGELYAMETSTGAGPQRISNLGSDSYTTYRYIRYIQPNRTGTNVAFQTTTLASYNEMMADREQIQVATGIAFSSAGALSGTLNRFAVESTNGRAGTSMSWDFTNTRLYYAFGAGASNENAMQLVEATLNATGSGVATKRTQLGVNGTTARFSVLNAGR